MLEVDGITKKFGSREVLRNISFTLSKAETVAIVGSSGAGKSVLAGCIAGLIVPDRGSVRFHEGPGRMQLLFQDCDGTLSPNMTVKQIVEEPLRILGLSSGGARISDLLDHVSLPKDVLRRYARELSGGQRQRVAIARALATNPALLIADEPAASLDPSLQAEIFSLLQTTCHRVGMSILLISHNLPVVNLMSQRILRLENGSLLLGEAIEH